MYKQSGKNLQDRIGVGGIEGQFFQDASSKNVYRLVKVLNEGHICICEYNDGKAKQFGEETVKLLDHLEDSHLIQSR